MPTKAHTPKAEHKSEVKTPRKPRVAAHKALTKTKAAHSQASKAEQVQSKVEEKAKKQPVGKYIFATGRRKTAIANVRLFEGQGESLVNKKPLGQYFDYQFYRHEVDQPFDLTGLAGQYYFVASISGGGPHAQAGALRHGIATALAGLSEDVRKILKKNGLLTRDDRKKERKKPGLKRARRSPQWAKR